MVSIGSYSGSLDAIPYCCHKSLNMWDISFWIQVFSLPLVGSGRLVGETGEGKKETGVAPKLRHRYENLYSAR